MKKLMTQFIIGTMVFLLAACATVEDVRRATDLMRTDNELARILQDVRPIDQIAAAMDLVNLATHAKGEADALKGTQSKIPDAIAYYRIASTAYWRSGNPEVVNALFEVTNNGTDLCNNLGDKAPDRDCLFLRLVIPFAGLESNANGKGLSGLLGSVNFNDGNATPEEIKTMGEIRKSLNQAKPLVQKILTVGEDNRLLSHPGMGKYYCDNAKKATGYYHSIAAVFEILVIEFYAKIPNDRPPLGITEDEASGLRKLEEDMPSFCQ
jgi:hypothetical protein